MAKLVELWREADPPAGAVYDVDALEFDRSRSIRSARPFELMLRDRVNQAARAVTPAFASGSDLDAIATRYPGGAALAR
jgi:phage-related baseplate assembly protein